MTQKRGNSLRSDDRAPSAFHGLYPEPFLHEHRHKEVMGRR